MPEAKRLLLFCEYATLNGGERSLLSVLPNLIDHRYKVFVVLPDRGNLVDALRQFNVTVIPFEFYRLDGTRLDQTSLRLRLQTILQEVRPDLVHANSVSTSRLSGPVVRSLGYSSVGHLRDMIRLSKTALADLSCHTRLAAVSQATKNWYVDAGLTADSISVVYNGVDLHRFRPRQPTGFLHRQLDLPPTAQIAGAVGQIGMRKGLDVLLEAMSRVMSEHEQFHLLVVGERYSAKAEAIEFERSLHNRACEIPLRGRVHFLGYRTDVDQVLPELYLLVHAACQEPLGRVLLEAAATGVAIVATNVGGTTEIFPTDAGAAVLVSPEDPHALATAISASLADTVRCARLGAAARQRAESAFDTVQAARKLLDLYDLVTAGRTSSP